MLSRANTKISLVILILGLSCGYFLFPLQESKQSIKEIEASAKIESHRLQADIKRLESLGYLGGYQAPEPSAESSASDSTHNPSDNTNHYTLITSGHAPEAYLIDRMGRVAHKWTLNFESIFPNAKITKNARKRDLKDFLRSVVLLENGELLAIFDGLGLVKVNHKSDLIWANYNGAHHDLEVLSDNTILVLTRKVKVVGQRALLEDFISQLTASGEEIQSFSLVDSLVNSKYKLKLLGKRKLRGDLLHSNSLQSLNSSQASKLSGALPGDVLVSMRNINALGIFRPSTSQLIWAEKGIFKRQHFARINADGSRLYLFDNIGARQHSRVLFYDWPGMQLVKSVDASIERRFFFTRSLGLAHQLNNGNLLIVESERGRLIELDHSLKQVWSFTSPYRTGKDNKLIATIPHAERVAIERVESWIHNPN